MSQWAISTCQYLKRIHFLDSGFVRLTILLVMSIGLTSFLANNGSVSAETLLQSPPLESPPTDPPTEVPPTEVPPVEAPADSAPPVEAPADSAPPVEATPTDNQTENVESEQTDTTFQSPAASPVLTTTPTLNEAPPMVLPTPLPASRAGRESDPIEEGDEGGASNLILDQVELIDSVVVSGAYVWLCCGIGLFLLLPLVFLLLQIRGQLKLQKEDDF